ncbi:MAG: flagellar motor switch protein FliN [bacterium]|nr:flagellar motor switch protein FliN [bacterium]
MSNTKLDNLPDTDRWLAETFCTRLEEVLETMTGERPRILVGGEGTGQDSMDWWWEQSLSVSGDAKISIGSGKPTCSALGDRALTAAGIEEAEEKDIQQTYLELLQQSLSGFSQAVGAKIGREVNCDEGRETQEAPAGAFIPIEVRYSDTEVHPAGIMLSDSLSAACRDPGAELPKPAPPETPALPAHPPPADSSPHPKQMELLLDVELPVSVSFGRAHLPLKDVLKLTSGSIVELNRPVAEPVEVIVNNCVLARGEVVVVDGNYGVRINQIISRHERLRTLN